MQYRSDLPNPIRKRFRLVQVKRDWNPQLAEQEIIGVHSVFVVCLEIAVSSGAWVLQLGSDRLHA